MSDSGSRTILRIMRPFILLFSLFSLPLLSQETRIEQSEINPWQEERRIMTEEVMTKEGVQNLIIKNAFLRVPRHLYLPDSIQYLAYQDMPVPLDQSILPAPSVLVRILKSVKPTFTDKLLIVGRSTEYFATICSLINRDLYVVDPVISLSQENIYPLRQTNYAGIWQNQMPFDIIIFHASASEIPEILTAQLAPGGRLIFSLETEGGFQQLILMTKGELETDGWKIQSLGSTFMPPW